MLKVGDGVIPIWVLPVLGAGGFSLPSRANRALAGRHRPDREKANGPVPLDQARDAVPARQQRQKVHKSLQTDDLL